MWTRLQQKQTLNTSHITLLNKQLNNHRISKTMNTKHKTQKTQKNKNFDKKINTK